MSDNDSDFEDLQPVVGSKRKLGVSSVAPSERRGIRKLKNDSSGEESQDDSFEYAYETPPDSSNASPDNMSVSGSARLPRHQGFSHFHHIHISLA